MTTFSYTERAALCPHPLAQRLLRLLDTKQTNLGISADVTSSAELLHLAETLGPDICLFKTHIDIISDFTPALTNQLKEIAKRHDFLLFEDRKFADIGQTVQHQHQGGIYRIADWADIINAHALPGPGIIAGLRTPHSTSTQGLLLLAEMSSAGNLLDAIYTEKTLEMAEAHEDMVIGFISQRKISNNPHWIYLAPGVSFQTQGDSLGQQHQTPEHVILHKECDIMFVGRGITQTPDMKATARAYREAGWAAYQKRLASA